MLDTAGKLLERLLKSCIIIKNAGDLSGGQHGFKIGRSTIRAVEDVACNVKETRRVKNFSRPIVDLSTIDMGNLFNAAKWVNMIDALKSWFKTLSQLDENIVKLPLRQGAMN